MRANKYQQESGNKGMITNVPRVIVVQFTNMERSGQGSRGISVLYAGDSLPMVLRRRL